MHLCLDIICPTHIDYHTQSPTERNIGKKNKQPLQKNGKEHHLKQNHINLYLSGEFQALFFCKTSQKTPRCGPGRTTSRHVFIKAKFITQIDHCHDLRMTVSHGWWRWWPWMARRVELMEHFPETKKTWRWLALCVFHRKQTNILGSTELWFLFFLFVTKELPICKLCQVSVVPLRCPASCCSSCASSDTELGRLDKVSWSMLFLRMSHSK